MNFENSGISSPQAPHAAGEVEGAPGGAEGLEADAMGAVFDRLRKPGEREQDEALSQQATSGTKDGEDAEPASTQEPALEAPDNMPQDLKDEWEKLTPRAREALAAHHSEMDQKFGEIMSKSRKSVQRFSVRTCDKTRR